MSPPWLAAPELLSPPARSGYDTVQSSDCLEMSWTSPQNRARAIGAIAALAIVLVAFQARLCKATEPNAAIAALVVQLGSSDFTARQQAAAQLELAGVESIPLLTKTAIEADAEIRARAQTILLANAFSSSAEMREAVRRSIREHGQLLYSHGAGQEQAALRRIREALASAATAELARRGAMVMPVQNGPPLNYSVQIGQTWTGGNERLALLADLGDIPWLSVENARLSDAALAHIARLTGLTRLFLGSSGISGSGLAQLAPLKKLQYLSLKQLPINDARLAGLPDFPDLQYLGLDGTRIGNEGLKKVASYRQLQVLWLDNTAVTDAGLIYLQSLTSLRTLYLPGTSTAGPGLAELRHLPSLMSLSLKGVKLTSDSLKHVAQLEQLESLGLDQTNVTDDQLAALAGLARLRIVWLSGTQVSDAAVEHLKAIRSLEVVHLSDTQVSSEGAAELQHALPNCQVMTASRLKPTLGPPPGQAQPRRSP